LTYDINEITRLRFRVLEALYDISNANVTSDVRSYVIAQELGIEETIVMSVMRYFQGKELVEIVPFRPSGVSYDLIRIKTKGIDEVEIAHSGKETPIEHFGPNIVTIVGSQVTNSPIQQASPNSTQVVAMTENRIKELRKLIEEMKELLQEPLLKHEEKNDLQAEIQTIQGQLSSSKPKIKIITESITSARTILEGVSSTCAAAAPLITRISMWLHGIT
jgi:hypothetical protein